MSAPIDAGELRERIELRRQIRRGWHAPAAARSAVELAGGESGAELRIVRVTALSLAGDTRWLAVELPTTESNGYHVWRSYRTRGGAVAELPALAARIESERA